MKDLQLEEEPLIQKWDEEQMAKKPPTKIIS